MSERFSDARFSRADFLKGAIALSSGLYLSQIPQIESSGANTEQFATTPSWSQDFSKMKNGQPDPKYWNYVLGNTVPGYNYEAETLTKNPNNVRIENGVLVIEARVQNKNDRQYTSAYITTQGKFGFEYGKLETSLKLPNGIGTWPAAWLLPTKPKYNPAPYGLTGSDASWKINGEIDFAEAIGFMPGFVYPSDHTAANFSQKLSDPFHKTVKNDTSVFHTYGVEKLPSNITFTFDGKPYLTIPKRSDSPIEWPFEQEYFLILNLAMGGKWGGMDKNSTTNSAGIDNASGPWKYEIESINFYNLNS